MKTGERNFVQYLDVFDKKQRVRRWGQRFGSDNLEEIFPDLLSAKLAKSSPWVVLAPLTAATIRMFVGRVKDMLNSKEMPYGITDLTDVPFKPDNNSFLYLVFVVNGKAVVMRGDLADICLDNSDIVVGLVTGVVFWGPRHEVDKLQNALVQFAKEIGFSQLEAGAVALLTDNKRVIKYLPTIIKEFYGIT